MLPATRYEPVAVTFSPLPQLKLVLNIVTFHRFYEHFTFCTLCRLNSSTVNTLKMNVSSELKSAESNELTLPPLCVCL